MYYSLHLYAICFKEYMYRFITRLVCNVLGEVDADDADNANPYFLIRAIRVICV